MMFETPQSMRPPSQSPDADSSHQDDPSSSADFLEDFKPGPDDDGKSCLVCGHTSHGYHFGILACRACAAFFRRTVAEKKIYKCRQNCECPIRKEMRNMCRACRFKKCLGLGMNKNDVQMNRDPIGRRREPKSECCVKAETSCCNASTSAAASLTGLPCFDDPLPTISATALLTPPASGGVSAFPALSTSGAASAAVLYNSPVNATGLAPALCTTSAATSSSTVCTSAGGLGHAAGPAAAVLNPLDLAQLQGTLGGQLLGGLNGAAVPIQLVQSGLRPTSTIALLPYTPPGGPSVLQRMHEGYANYQSSQKSLYTVMYPDNIFAPDTYRMVKHSEHVKMERGCLSLMFSMVNDWFQPFDTLAHDLKVMVLRAFSANFCHLDQTFKTMNAFPDPQDTRLVLHYGQFIDTANMHYFFQEDKDPTVSAQICKPVMFKCHHLVNKMRRLNIREVEVAALAGVILWNEVALSTSLEVADKLRDRIYSELHSNIIITYGVSETGARMGSLLCLLNDLNVISKEISESTIISKIFNPHVSEPYEESQ